MRRVQFSMNDSLLVSVNVTAARPTLATDGVDITSWLTNNQFCGAKAAVFLEGTAGATVTSPTSGADGVELWGYRLNKWWLIAELRDGRDVTVAVGVGYVQATDVIGIFERLAVAGTASAGTAAAHLAPIEEWS